MAEFSVVRPDGAAVRTQERRIFFARNISKRLVKVAGNCGAVFAFEMDVLAMRNFELGEEGIVRVSDLSKLSAGNGEEFVGPIDRGELDDYPAVGINGVAVYHAAPGNKTCEILTCDRDPEKVLCTVVVGDEVDGFAIRSVARGADHAIQRQSQDFGGAAGGGRDGEMTRGVIKKMRVEHCDVGDRLPVR